MIKFDEDKQKKQVEELHLAEEESVVKILSKRYDLPYLELSSIPINTDALRLIPEDMARKAGVAGFRLIGKKIDVALTHPKKEETIMVLKELTQRGYKPMPYMVSQRSVRRAWERYAEISFAKETEAGVLEIAHDQLGLKFIGFQNRLLDVVVDGRIFSRQEARTHVHALRTQRHRRHQASAVGHATGGHKRNSQFLRRSGQQDEVGNVVLARMTTTFETVDADRVAANVFCLKGMAHRRTLVNYLDTGSLQLWHVLLRTATGGFHRLHSTLYNGINVVWIGRSLERGQESQIYPERLVGHGLAAGDLPGQILGGGLGQAGDDAETARIGNR